jgi:hypothetical protein
MALLLEIIGRAWKAMAPEGALIHSVDFEYEPKDPLGLGYRLNLHKIEFLRALLKDLGYDRGTIRSPNKR